MPDPDHRPEPGSRPTAWVLAAPGAGDNRQLETLVELLGVDARWIDQIDPVPRVLRDRVTGFRARDVPSEKRATYAPPWPELVLIAGGRAVIDACRIRNASDGHSRVVCLGRPWAPLRWFDLVVTSPQYRLPEAENVVVLDLPLNLPPRSPEDVLAHWRDKLEDLPRPILGVLLGGDSGSYRFDGACAEKLADMINELVGEAGGSAVLVGSPRTPSAAIERLERNVEVTSRIHAWEPQSPNPYASMLQLADALLVTGDSASMLAEACRSSKPVAMFDLHERMRSRLNRKLRAATPAMTRITEALTARGLWIPARDMPNLHWRAAASGWLTDPEVLMSGAAQSNSPEERPLHAIRERLFAILDPQVAVRTD